MIALHFLLILHIAEFSVVGISITSSNLVQKTGLADVSFLVYHISLFKIDVDPVVLLPAMKTGNSLALSASMATKHQVLQD